MKSFIVALMLVAGSVCADSVFFQVPGVPTKEEREWTSKLFNSMTSAPAPSFREGWVHVDTNFHAAMSNYGLTNAVRELAKDGTICRVLGHRWEPDEKYVRPWILVNGEPKWEGDIMQYCPLCNTFRKRMMEDKPCKTCGHTVRVLGGMEMKGGERHVVQEKGR